MCPRARDPKAKYLTLGLFKFDLPPFSFIFVKSPSFKNLFFIIKCCHQELDPSVPAHASPASTIGVLQRVLEKLDNCPLNTQNIKLAALMVRGCETIIEMKL